MSTVYNLEPQPTAKVLLKTTAGDIVLELFAKQTPITSRNFIQHCLDGYYENTIFHRLVPGFIIQGGDPTGLGTGGVSALGNGAPFEDEFHTRLRFNRRGLLGMANSGEPNDNTSQFFLTLDKTPELQGKNTMFGRVEGDTIYNMQRMGEGELAEEGSDRPLYPFKVTGAEILVNPFEDMVKKVTVAERTKGEDGGKVVKKKRKAGKTLLSFGADEGEEEGPVIKKAKVNPNFKSAQTEDAESSNSTTIAEASREAKAKPARPVRKRSSSASASSPAGKPTSAPVPKEASPPASPSPEPVQVKKTMSALERTNAEIAALKASMKRNVTTSQDKPEKKTSALEAMIPATATRGRKRGKLADEAGALKLFNQFKNRLGTTPVAENEKDPDIAATTGEAEKGSSTGVDGEEKLCDLHFIANCQSCTAWDDEGAKEAEDDNDTNWMAHKLSFAKDTLGKDLEWKRKMEGFEVIDPREKTKEIVSDKKKDRTKGGRDWDQRRDKGGSNRARV